MGMIYKILDLRTGEIVYIGSTQKSGFLRRFYAHYYNAKPERIGPRSMKISKHICQEGPRNFDILEHEEWNCALARDLVAREHHWIREFKPICNVHGR